jgi:hypothetical protein
VPVVGVARETGIEHRADVLLREGRHDVRRHVRLREEDGQD